MIKFINKAGNVMWVDESRKDEYLRLGHSLAPADKPKRSPRKAPAKKEDK